MVKSDVKTYIIQSNWSIPRLQIISDGSGYVRAFDGYKNSLKLILNSGTICIYKYLYSSASKKIQELS